MNEKVLLANIRRARMAAGLSQGAVAERLSVKRPTYTNMELGKRGISDRELRVLAELFGVSVAELMSCADDKDGSVATDSTQFCAALLGTYFRNGIPKAKLMRLCFIIDVEAVRKYGEAATGLRYEKFQNDVVSAELYYILDQMYAAGQVSVEMSDFDTSVRLIGGEEILSLPCADVVRKCCEAWKPRRPQELRNHILSMPKWAELDDGAIELRGEHW